MSTYDTGHHRRTIYHLANLASSECRSSTPRRIWGAYLLVAGNDELELVSKHEAEVKVGSRFGPFLDETTQRITIREG